MQNSGAHLSDAFSKCNIFLSCRVDTGFKVSEAREPAPAPEATTADPGQEQNEEGEEEGNTEEPQPAQV